MFKGIKMIKKSLLFVVVIAMIAGHFGLNTISGEGGVPIKDSKNSIPLAEINYDYFSNKLILEANPGLDKIEGDPETKDIVGHDMGDGEYTAYYSLNYYGTRLIVVATAQLESKSPYNDQTDAVTKVHIDDENLLRVRWYHQTATVKWTISLYEATGKTGYEFDPSKPYLKYFLVGFYDPDESSYIFNPDGRTIYYEDANSKREDVTTKTAAEYFEIVSGENGGLIKSTEDPRADFDAATFVVSILDGESKFSFKTKTLDQGSLQVPRLYSRNYNITYDYNDSEGPTHTIEEENQASYASSPNVVTITKDPKRVGYKFLGWNNETDNPTEGQLPTTYKRTIDADASGDKVFKAYWEPVKYSVLFDPNPSSAKEGAVASGETADMTELVFNSDYNLTKNGYEIPGYKFLGWSLNEGEDTVVYNDEQGFKNLVNYLADSGDVDLENPVKLYAQWEPIQYKIMYNPNEPEGTTSEGVMSDQEPLSYDTQYNLNENAYSIEGHDFLGWSTEPGVHDVVYNDKQDFINLTQEDGGVVTLYAQWKPWNYYISYDANGGYGDMPRQVFTSRDDSMRSAQNQFNRDGYIFMGFEFTYNNTKYYTATTEELRDMLKSLGKDSEITLIAQWMKSPTPEPEPEVKRYSLPITGVDR